MRNCWAISLLLAGVAAVPESKSIFAWHITDPHVDPFYTAGAPTEGCYCRSHSNCPARPSSASCEPSTLGNARPAGVFGDAEANCETPELLWTSSLKYASAARPEEDISMVLFTGDFCAYMLETPCNNSAHGLEPGTSREGIRTCVQDTHKAMRKAFPNSFVLPSLGNHDTVVLQYASGKSGAAFGGSDVMQWLYAEVADLWAHPDVIGCAAQSEGDLSCAAANATLHRGGYFSTRLDVGSLNVTVISLNTNYWSLQSNPALEDPEGDAHKIGEEQFAWAERQLEAAASRGDRALVLGHIPPYQGMWSPGNYKRWASILEPYLRRGMQLTHFFGHQHTDEWMLVRACGDNEVSDAECAGEALGLMVTSPSVSFSYPAANPAVRLVEFDAGDFALKDMLTYSSDLHAANLAGEVEWGLEYSFAQTFGLADGVSPAAMAKLVDRMAREDSQEWHTYRGAETGTFYCRGWLADAGSADSHCPQHCQGDCKQSWLQVLNGTGTSPAVVV